MKRNLKAREPLTGHFNSSIISPPESIEEILKKIFHIYFSPQILKQNILIRTHHDCWMRNSYSGFKRKEDGFMSLSEHRKAFYRTEGRYYKQETEAEKEKKLIYSYYPKETVMVQAFVEDACDRLDYEGSFLYDEYPDKGQIERTCQVICSQMEDIGEIKAMESRKSGGKTQTGFWETLTATLFCQEMYRRRCRRNRCKRLW